MRIQSIIEIDSGLIASKELCKVSTTKTDKIHDNNVCFKKSYLKFCTLVSHLELLHINYAIKLCNPFSSFVVINYY